MSDAEFEPFLGQWFDIGGSTVWVHSSKHIGKRELNVALTGLDGSVTWLKLCHTAGKFWCGDYECWERSDTVIRWVIQGYHGCYWSRFWPATRGWLAGYPQESQVQLTSSAAAEPFLNTTRDVLAKGADGTAKGGTNKQGKGKGAKSDGGLPRHVQVSKALTQILRHRALDYGVLVGSDGFCELSAVMGVFLLRDLECSIQDVERVVCESDKQRFELKEEDGLRYIRANQGHSMKVVQDDLLLRRLNVDDTDLPPSCVHGTYRSNYDGILRSGGLLAGGIQGGAFRNHVHFAPRDPGDKRVISGMRYNCEIAIWIDLPKALAAGVPFYISANEVILSPGIDGLVSMDFFSEVRDLRSKEILWTP